MVEAIFGALGPLPDLSAIAAKVSWATVASFAAGALLALAATAYPRLRYLFHRLRLDRRLAQDPFILREELAEYRRAMGEEPQPIELDRLLPAMLLGGALAGGPALLADLALEGWFELAVLTFEALVVAAWLWSRLNDPPELQQPLFPSMTIPREAVLGALVAAAIVLFMLAIIAWVF